jgi:hypothetical protein
MTNYYKRYTREAECLVSKLFNTVIDNNGGGGRGSEKAVSIKAALSNSLLVDIFRMQFIREGGVGRETRLQIALTQRPMGGWILRHSPSASSCAAVDVRMRQEGNERQ